MRTAFCLLTICAAEFAFAQPPTTADDVRIRYGVKLGVQMLDSFDAAAGFHSEESRFVGGGMAELRWNDYLGAEIDVLYRRFRFDALLPISTTPFVAYSITRAHALDFPILARWKPLGSRPIAPFVQSGVALRYVNANETRRFFAGANREEEFSASFAQQSSFNVGWAIGGGAIFRQEERVRIAPELRYTFWGRDNFSASALGGVPGSLTSTNNQLELLVGVTF